MIIGKIEGKISDNADLSFGKEKRNLPYCTRNYTLLFHLIY